MGALDDSDIEKITQAVKKRKIPKRFNDPVKGYEAYDIAVTVAAGAIFLAAFFFIFGNFINDDLKSTNQLLIEQRDQARERTLAVISLIVENADCPTLFHMYGDTKDNPDLDYTRSQIKDEISFRCR